MDPYGQSRYELGIDAKIVVMGNTGVGKTSLLRRYTQGKFGPKNTTSTAGAFFVTKEVSVGGVKVCLQLWDTSGWERFRRMAPMYYRGANAALLLYDITNQASFEGVRGWLEELRKNCAAELIIYIVGAKADLAPRRQVSPDRARTSLHHWFSPPAPISGFAVYGYILPRFTLFAPSHPSPPSAPPDSPSSADALLGSAKSAHAGARVAMPAWGESRVLPGTWPGQNAGGYSVVEDAEADRAGERGWGLAKGIELFEVSAKDDSGIAQLFDTLVGAIVAARATVKHTNEEEREKAARANKNDTDVSYLDSVLRRSLTKLSGEPTSAIDGQQDTAQQQDDHSGPREGRDWEVIVQSEEDMMIKERERPQEDMMRSYDTVKRLDPSMNQQEQAVREKEAELQGRERDIISRTEELEAQEAEAARAKEDITVMEQKLWHEENELQSRLDECERREEDLRHKETDFLRREHELVQMEEANAQRELRLNNRLQHVLRRELEVVERERAVSRSPPGAPSPPTEAVSDPADDRETRMRSSRRDTLTSEISAQYTIRSVLSTNERTNHTYSPRRDRLNVSGQPNLPP